MKKCVNYLSVLALFILTISFCPVVQVEAGEDEALTLSYFLSTPGKNLIYQCQYSDGTTGQQMSVWEKDATGIYTNSVVLGDGSYNFEKYVLDNNNVVRFDSGFSIPQSEWSNYPVILGKNIVFKNVAAGSSWTNDYQTKDGWETVCLHKSNYIFVGFENLVVMGKEVQAARLNCREEKTIVSESPNGAEWGQLPMITSCDQWYVNGIGLVKSCSTTDIPMFDQQYTTTAELIDIVDVAITPNKAVTSSIWSSPKQFVR